MRVEITEGPHKLKPGEYGQWRGTWYARPPCDADLIANLCQHEVHEHADGSLSVRPSIWVEAGAIGTWHGFLWAGQWSLNPPAEGMMTWPTCGVEVPPVADLTDERIAEMGHRYAWRYKHSSDPNHSHAYTFNARCLRDFARAIERELKGGDPWSRVTERKPNGEPSSYERPPTGGVGADCRQPESRESPMPD